MSRRRVLLVAPLGLGLAFLLGAQAGPRVGRFDEVRTGRVVLVGGDGRELGTLGLGPRGVPSLELATPDGRGVAMLRFLDGRDPAWLLSGRDRGSFTVRLGADGPTVELRDGAGKLLPPPPVGTGRTP